MTIKLSTIIVIAVCCLALSQEARANRVIANTDVYYDSAQNRMVGYTEASSSYFAGMYYCLSVTVYVFSNDGQWAGNSAWDGCLYGYARTEATLPYDPNAEYSVDGEHTADPYYRNDLGELIDYYNFQTYLEGIPVYYPGSYQFMGPGPRRPSIGAILLGTTLALFSQGTRHGPPHHLRVVSDTTNDDCGSKKRAIRFQVVDSGGRRTGTTTTRERFYDPNTGSQMSSVYNSCRNENINPSGCSVDIAGIFTDQLWVGCPTVGGFCGTNQFISKWVWCPRGRPEVVLTSNTYHIRDTFVHVNGGSQFAPGTHLYP
jgi:hypothetical protein